MKFLDDDLPLVLFFCGLDCFLRPAAEGPALGVGVLKAAEDWGVVEVVQGDSSGWLMMHTEYTASGRKGGGALGYTQLGGGYGSTHKGEGQVGWWWGGQKVRLARASSTIMVLVVCAGGKKFRTFLIR